MRRLFSLLVFCIVFGEITCSLAADLSQDAKPGKNDTPVLLKADQLRHERKLGIVVGRGNVEISQGDRILRADTVSYNQKTDILTATGNVVLLEPTGDITFADFVELSGDFKMVLWRISGFLCRMTRGWPPLVDEELVAT